MIIPESTNKSNGVAIYVVEVVAYEFIPAPGNLCFTFLFIRCFSTENVIHCCMYNSPSSNYHDFLNGFEILLTCLQQHDLKFVIFADFNIELLQNSKLVDECYKICD